MSRLAAGMIVGCLCGLLMAGLLVRQFRKPRSLLGRLVAKQMNESHRQLTEWALTHVIIDSAHSILDVGCGGGATVSRLAASAPSAMVHGIDYSSACVDTARRTNATLIQEGRVSIDRASVSALPFELSSFDLVTAVETHYYWPDLQNDLREIIRVLKPDGQFIIVAEAYRGRRLDWIYRPAMRVLGGAYMTPGQHRDAMTAAGFRSVEVVQHPKGWMCAVGIKAA